MKKIVKLFILIVLTLVTMIALKSSNKFKTYFYKHVFDTNISFAQINKWYKNKFGSPIPFSQYLKEKPVFNEKLKYSEANIYKDGVVLKVDTNLIPAMDSGIVIFIGEKEGYGKTVIVEQENGIDVWYSNLIEVSVNNYDYINEGSLIGEVVDNLYLVFIKNGIVVNYKEYI